MGSWGRVLLAGAPVVAVIVASPATGAVPLTDPGPMAAAPGGQLDLVQPETGEVLAWRQGRLQVVTGTGLRGADGIAAAPGGGWYVADASDDRLLRLTASGAVRLAAAGAGLTDPMAVAASPSGRVFVADEVGVQAVGRYGALTTVVPDGPGTLMVDGQPTALSADAVAVSAAGDLFVGDFSPKLVIELSPSGRVLASWPTYVAPGGLAAGADGSVVVADYGNFAVDRIDRGQLQVVHSFQRDEIPGLDGTFRPSGVAPGPGNAIYVDTDGHDGGTGAPALVELDHGRVDVLDQGPATIS